MQVKKQQLEPDIEQQTGSKLGKELLLFLLTVQSFSIFGCKEYNQSDFCTDPLVISMFRVFACFVETEKIEGVCMEEGKNNHGRALGYSLKARTRGALVCELSQPPGMAQVFGTR